MRGEDGESKQSKLLVSDSLGGHSLVGYRIGLLHTEFKHSVVRGDDKNLKAWTGF